jgi:hypothetical protein
MIKHICNIFLFAGILLGTLSLSSCNDFEELNQNPTTAEKVNPNTQLTYIQLRSWGDWGPNFTYFSYISSFTQHLQGEWNNVQFGGQYRRDNERTKILWDNTYQSSIKNIEDVLSTTDGEPQFRNVRAIVRIMRVYYFMILTDIYGDIPYSEGGKGYVDRNPTPAYDLQENIYKDFLKELKEAENELSADGGIVTGDIMYEGDINKWKRLANSLRLRTSMRLVYVDPALAKSEVADVLSAASGLMNSSENALVKYLDINSWEGTEIRRNALAQSWRSRETYPNQFICSVFWNYLKNTEDPRLFRLARCYEEIPAAENNPFARVDLTDEILTLMGWNLFQPCEPGWFWYSRWPSGYMSPTTNSWIAKACRPQVSNDFLRGDVPGVIFTYAETQFLLAEAAVRWPELITASPENLYNNGVASAMNFLLNYKVKAYANDEISNYLTKNPFPSETEQRLKAINEQLWILHFNNPPEAYSNWRRSGYPELKPSKEYGAVTIESQEIPRRLNYPLDEARYNKEELDKALQRIGGFDNWNAKVWWDKK